MIRSPNGRSKGGLSEAGRGAEASSKAAGRERLVAPGAVAGSRNAAWAWRAVAWGKSVRNCHQDRA